jgi:hypothetical protein
MRTRIPVLLICAGLAAAGCSHAPSSPASSKPPASPSTGAAAATTPPAGSGNVSSSDVTGPKTAAAAKSAATLFLDLYAANQSSATYQLLSPSAKKVITEQTWDSVHQACKNTPGQSYTVTQPVLTGSKAVVDVSLAGTQSDLGSDREDFVYRGDRWYFEPPDLKLYRHHTAAQVVAELKSLDECT